MCWFGIIEKVLIPLLRKDKAEINIYSLSRTGKWSFRCPEEE